MLCHHDLVGRDHMLAGGDGTLQVSAHRLVAPGDLHQNVDGGIFEEIGRVDGQQVGRNLDGAVLLQVPDQHALQAQLDAGAARELRLRCQQPLRHLRSDRAESDEPHI